MVFILIVWVYKPSPRWLEHRVYLNIKSKRWPCRSWSCPLVLGILWRPQHSRHTFKSPRLACHLPASTRLALHLPHSLWLCNLMNNNFRWEAGGKRNGGLSKFLWKLPKPDKVFGFDNNTKSLSAHSRKLLQKSWLHWLHA